MESIRERFKLSKHRLRTRQRHEGWTVRRQVATPYRLPHRKPVGADEIGFRLNRLLVNELAMLERRLAEEGMSEANARTLVELCRAEEIRMRSIANKAKTAKTRETKDHDDGADASADEGWLRTELKKRIHRIRAAVGRGSEG